MSEQEKKGKLSRFDLYNLAIGPGLGSGFLIMTGIAIGITGRSINIGYIIGAFLALAMFSPHILIAGTANFHGGMYSQIGVLGGKKLAGFFIYLSTAMTIGMSMTAMSFAEYCLSLLPNVNKKFLALAVFTVLCLVNMTNVKNASRLQNLMTTCLLIAFALYIFFGVQEIKPGYFKQPGFMPNGLFGLLHGSILLSMTYGGSVFVANFSSQAKNPVKDIPIVILSTMFIIAIIYCVAGTVAAGIAPLEVTAGQPLSTVANSFMPNWAFYFFVVGGALLGMLTSLNSGLAAKPYPMLTAAGDGWLPKVLLKRNKMFGTPHIIYLVIYVMAVVPILLGLDLATMVNSMAILGMSLRVLVSLSALNLPKVMPELWEKNPLYVKDTTLKFLCYLSIAVDVIAISVMTFTKSLPEIVANLGVLAIILLLTAWRQKDVEIKPTYEAI